MIRRPRRTLRIAVGVMAPAVATLALVPLRTDVVNVNLALVLVLGVLAVGAGAGRVAGLVAAGVAALSYDALPTRPYGSLRIHEGEDVLTTALLGVVGVTAALLTEHMRRHAFPRGSIGLDLAPEQRRVATTLADRSAPRSRPAPEGSHSARTEPTVAR